MYFLILASLISLGYSLSAWDLSIMSISTAPSFVKGSVFAGHGVITCPWPDLNPSTQSSLLHLTGSHCFTSVTRPPDFQCILLAWHLVLESFWILIAFLPFPTVLRCCCSSHDSRGTCVPSHQRTASHSTGVSTALMVVARSCVKS